MADKQKVVSQVAQKFAERESLRTKPRVKVAPHTVLHLDEQSECFFGWCAWPCRAAHAEQSDDTAPARSEPRPDAAP
jgi:hypothetical protein